MSILDRIIEYSPQERTPKQNGGRTGFVDGLSALSFGKEQSIFSPQNFQRLFSATGQRDYPKAYKVITDALEKAGITYTPKSKGAGFDFGNVTKETVDIFNKEATKLKAERNLPMSRYQSAKIKKDIKTFVKDKIKKGEYVSRPIIKEYFGLTKGKSGDMLITRSLGINEKPGTGLLKNLGQEEKKAATKINFSKATDAKMETKNAVLKIINDEFKLDPDLSNSEDLAKIIYGDQFPEGDIKNMSSKDLKKAEAMVRQTDNDVMTYLKVVQGVRKKPDGMRLPTQNVINDIVDNILTGIDDEVADGKSQFKKKSFRFSSGLLRDYKMAIVNTNLGLDPDTFRSERAKLVLKNKNLDEIFSISALADIAPGYTTKVQSIKKVINRKKANEIDLPFQRIINALNEGKTSMKINKKTVPIETVIKDFNKTSAEFSKKNKVQSPKINYNEKFDKTILDSYGKASQENIKQVYKDKKFFLSEINPEIKTQDILVNKPLRKKLMVFCPKSVGGEAGVCSIDEAIQGLISESKQFQSGKMNPAQAKKTAEKIKAVTRVGTGSTLKSLLGPYGVTGEVVIDGAIMANRMLDEGDTYKETLSKSLIKYAMPTDKRKKLEEETDRSKMILGSDTRGLAADYVSAQQKYEDLIKKYQNFQKIKKDETFDPDTLVPTYSPRDEIKAEKEFQRAQVRAEPLYKKNIFDILKFGSPEQEAFAAKEEVFDAEKMQRRMDYDRKILGPLKDLFGTGFYSPEQLKRLQKKADRDTEIIGLIPDELKTKQVADFGGVANLAGGGIAEIRRPSSIPPQSGPTPQGLLSIKNNVKRY